VWRRRQHRCHTLIELYYWVDSGIFPLRRSAQRQIQAARERASGRKRFIGREINPRGVSTLAADRAREMVGLWKGGAYRRDIRSMRAGNPRLVWKAIHAGHAADALLARSSEGGLVPTFAALWAHAIAGWVCGNPKRPEGMARTVHGRICARVLFCSLALKASLKDLSVSLSL
jgi:hypothetical protein